MDASRPDNTLLKTGLNYRLPALRGNGCDVMIAALIGELNEREFGSGIRHILLYKSVRTTMRLKWAFWDILGHFGTTLDILGHFGTIRKTF